MASTGAFLSALHIRPIMDVLWTEAVQPDNTEHLAKRGNISHRRWSHLDTPYYILYR